ncbi:calcium-activated potassium channel slowpoke-like isoform X2 [Hydractinia symbiolongicarpus]|uniref:calcium-activated potassium channel slowpoke-like isoform X2 n=1 Tax=Hydractinia symbiolongicarpus TaxID=13093 RepID=UPI0025513A9B|nr:calcium-activated potassium channel slowpoke-like isoform X2 [Hydractinia symbiolongicarpus]
MHQFILHNKKLYTIHKDGFCGNFLLPRQKSWRKVILSFICNLAACALYITESSYPVEHCLKDDDILWKVEIILNGFFIFHFIIRFFAAHDKLHFWTSDPLTIIDFLTVPTVFLAIYYDRNWIGLRFVRVITMMNLSEILQFLNVLTAGTAVELVHMLGTFLAVWLTSAGMVHLFENTGDFWPPISYQNNRTINFFESTYFLLVTMSTVGYGDIYCMTYLGRLFCMFFIAIGLGLFASYLPAIQAYFSSHTKYHLNFKPTAGKKHVIVAGHITENSIKSFLRDFLHPDRDDPSTTAVFLSPELPDVAMQAILKRYESRALYYVGTIYSTEDCARMQMRKADAVIILCNKKSHDPEEEDSENITRVISVKNFYENTRCIVQLIMNASKSHLLNCPQWNRSLGDEIVCINELKLGFMAQSCNAPGFSTLIGNLFSMRSDTTTVDIHESEQWKVAYITGAANEIYTAHLSNSFAGLTFVQAVEICFEKLNLLLIAIEIKISKTEKYVSINPSGDEKLGKNCTAYVFAQSQLDADRVSKYCSICHKDLVDAERMVRCRCRRNRKRTALFSNNNKKQTDTLVDLDPTHLLEEIVDDSAKLQKNLTGDYYPNGDKPKFDQSGTFYWCEGRSFEVAKLTLNEAASEKFKNHVLILVLSTRESASLELRQLVLPLRASNTNPASLKKVVILGDGEFLQREWRSLTNFPDVDVVAGSPYNRSDLRAVNVDTADMVILLSPGFNAKAVEHQALSDKKAILVTLNLKAMRFDRSKLSEYTSSQGNGNTMADQAVEGDPAAVTHGTGLPTSVSRNPSRMTVVSQGGGSDTTKALEVTEDWQTALIPMITELLYDSNAMYLDQDDMNIYDDEEIFLTQPYACGSAFTVSVLDSLVSATYYNSEILTLVRNIVTGSVGSDLDELLSEGKQPNGNYETREIAATRNRCRVAQMSLTEGLLSDFGQCGTFGDLFLYALRTYNMICLGLYRYRDAQRSSPKNSKRYVITFPPFNFVLSPTDLVFVLMQFQSGKKKKRTGRKPK